MLALILTILAIVWLAGIALTIYEIIRAPIGPEEDNKTKAES